VFRINSFRVNSLSEATDQDVPIPLSPSLSQDVPIPKSIEAIQLLNGLGYGTPGSGLTLNFVFNPAGAFLPPAQHAIEADFRRELRCRYSIEFNSLYALANVPIGRFREFLDASGNFEPYSSDWCRPTIPSPRLA